MQCDGLVDRHIRPLLVGADGDEILVLAVKGQTLAAARGEGDFFGGSDILIESAHTLEHINCRIVVEMR